MRLLVIGDVHACDERLARLLAYADGLRVDATCCIGDVVTGPDGLLYVALNDPGLIVRLVPAE